MNLPFITGIIGSLILVTGAAWPAKKASIHPAKQFKNWLFAVGGATMFAYSILLYNQGGPIFFLMLQSLVGISSILMMTNAPKKISTPIILIAGIGLISWSLSLFEGYNTIIFTLGLMGISYGYNLKSHTSKRNLFLTIGSILIATFSYIEQNWIYFYLNMFYAVFSLYYTIKYRKKT